MTVSCRKYDRFQVTFIYISGVNLAPQIFLGNLSAFEDRFLVACFKGIHDFRSNCESFVHFLGQNTCQIMEQNTMPVKPTTESEGNSRAASISLVSSILVIGMEDRYLPPRIQKSILSCLASIFGATISAVPKVKLQPN